MSHTLTVITPVYNIAEHLPRFFESMASQTYTDYQLLVLDDGSTDDSLLVCRRYESRDDRIRVIHLEHGGIAVVRNTALDYLETPFAAYADGDDYVEPDYLKHLMDAQKKYDADLAVSRVQYHLENGFVEGAFRARGELLIERDQLNDNLPMLLDDRRLNYLYGKVYRTALLRDIRVKDDVRQGSDTMVNMQYIARVDRLVLIDDLDYHYIRYTKRSITSYSGSDAYERILRVNRFVYDNADRNGMLTDGLTAVIDARILQSAGWVIDKILASDNAHGEKAAQIDAILNDPYYIESYKRQKLREQPLDFEVIPPQSGSRFLQGTEKKKRRNQQKARILKKSPQFLKDVYHKLKGKDVSED